MLQHLESFFIQRGSNVVVDWHHEREHFLFVRERELNHITRTDVNRLGDEARETLRQYERLGNNELNLRTLNLTASLSQLPN